MSIPTIEELAIKQADTDARCRSNTHRIDELTKNQEALVELTTSVRVLATKQATIETSLSEIKTGLQTLKDKPGKRWEAIVDKGIWAVLGGLLAFALSQIGL